jgi:hypothetical protein
MKMSQDQIIDLLHNSNEKWLNATELQRAEMDKNNQKILTNWSELQASMEGTIEDVKTNWEKSTNFNLEDIENEESKVTDTYKKMLLKHVGVVKEVIGDLDVSGPGSGKPVITQRGD